MDATAAINALEARGYLVDIGQIDPDARLALQKELRSGRVKRVKAPLAGLMGMKTHYVADQTMFERAQAAAAASLKLAIALDGNARESNGRHGKKGRASRPVECEGTLN